ncbi:MAG: hypothetical protein CMJ95_02260 [Planctomycetes bacterium]|nr:hypothetical protein [Planctomycetota bacterium]
MFLYFAAKSLFKVLYVFHREFEEIHSLEQRRQNYAGWRAELVRERLGKSLSPRRFSLTDQHRKAREVPGLRRFRRKKFTGDG